MLSTEAGIKVKSVFTPQDANMLILHIHTTYKSDHCLFQILQPIMRTVKCDLIHQTVTHEQTLMSWKRSDVFVSLST